MPKKEKRIEEQIKEETAMLIDSFFAVGTYPVLWMSRPFLS